MQQINRPLAVVSAVGDGAFTDVSGFSDLNVQIAGTFDATLQIQGSIDGTNFVSVAADQMAPAVIPITSSLVLLRISTTAYTSGTPTAILAGLDQETS